MADVFPPHLFQDVTMRVWWAHRWRVGPGWRHSRPFRRPFTNVWYVLGGSMGVLIDNEEIVVEAGTLMVVPPGKTLDNWNAGDSRLDYLSLGLECLVGGIDIFHGEEPLNFKVALSSKALELWEAMVRETEAVAANPTLEANLRLAGYARLWWSETAPIIGGTAAYKVAAMDPRVGEALQWMRSNLHARLRASDLARMLQVSESYLRQLFASSLGTSFSRTLTDLRLQKAKRLLITTSKRIADIAAEVGYSDQQYFTRVFSRHEGVSPGAFRKAIRMDASKSEQGRTAKGARPQAGGSDAP